MKALTRTTWIWAIIALTLVTLACGSSATPAAQPDQVETIVAGTFQALTPLASATTAVAANLPTSAPTLTPIPTLTPVPANPIPAGTQIVFASGATYGIAEGTIQAGQTLSYYLSAAKDQPMIAMVNSTNNDVTMSIRAQDGTVLLPATQKASSWQGLLPGTETYYFQIFGGTGAETFSLSVNIPSRIQFVQGEDTITLTGQTVNGFAVSYVVHALAGQTLEATVNTSPEDAGLTIWGFADGQPYARAQNGVTDFSMTLPSTQDYIINVVPQGGRVINYSLKVTIK